MWYLDNLFFQGEGLKPEGKKFLDNIEDYREKVTAALGAEGFEDVKAAIQTRFETGDESGKVTRKRDGVKVDWMNYNYEGFPMVASLTKLTQLQADQTALTQRLEQLQQQLTEGEALGDRLGEVQTALQALEDPKGRCAVLARSQQQQPTVQKRYG